MDRGDLEFYGDVNLHRGEGDGRNDAPQVNLKLLGDFPEPLTEPQRRAVHRYVSRRVREYEVVRHQVAIVEKGYLALLRLVKRLRREIENLTTSLADIEKKASTSDAKASPSANTIVATQSVTLSTHEKKTSVTTTTGSFATSATREGSIAPKQRSAGMLLRSSVFSGLQRVLQAAKSEQLDEKAEQLARQRERIARESRLHLVRQDLETQEALLEPLKDKYSRAVAIGAAAAEEAIPLLVLLEDMWRLETLYPSRFSMIAKGTLKPLLDDGADVEEVGNMEEGEKVVVNTELTAGGTNTNPAAAVPFPVPFTPAQYTPDLEDLVRAQVEEVVDEYLAYRTRMDPVLYHLEQSQQLAKAKKVDELMDTIGIAGADAGAEVLPIGGAAALLDNPRIGSLPKTAQQMMNISSDDEDDQAEKGIMILGSDAADADRHDREQIQTALAALDDFEDA